MKRRRTQQVDGLAHSCTLLAIDPAATSGVACFVNGALSFHAPVDSALSRLSAIHEAHFAASRHKASPIIIAIEGWAGSWKSWKTAVGAGVALGRWFEVLEQNGHRRDHVVEMALATWRSRAGVGKCSDSKAYKRRAIEMVERKFGTTVGADEAEAILMGDVACRSPEVGEMLGTIERARK